MTTAHGLLDEANVTVDLSLLEAGLQFRAGALVGVLLATSALVWLFVRLPSNRRVLTLIPLGCAGVVAGGLWVLLAPAPWAFDELLKLWQRAVVVELAGAGAAAGALGVAIITLAFAVTRRVLILCGAALASGVLASGQMLAATSAFITAAHAATPIPNIRPFATPPRVHVGLTRNIDLVAESAGQTEGLFFPSRVEFPTELRAAWGLNGLAITANAAGPVSVPVTVSKGIVRCEASVTIEGVRDEGPSVFPLQVGNRWEFEGLHGRGGTTDARLKALEHGAKPKAAFFSLEVTGEDTVDGFHQFTLTETDPTGTRSWAMTRENDALVSRGEVVFRRGDFDQCIVNFLPIHSCTCANDRVSTCAQTSGDVGESLMRVFFALVTAGLTEIAGMGDLGAGNEQGLVLTRWVEGGVEHTLGPVPKIPKKNR